MKVFKRLVSILLLNVLMFSGNIAVKAASNSEFKSGIYSLQNDIYHSSETGRSMARTYLNPNMKMEIRNGQVYFTVKFSGAQYMENFRMIVDGVGVDVNTIDKNTASDTVTLKFKGNSPSSKITAKIYVGPMERDVSFSIIPKLETASLIKSIEEPKKDIVNKEDTSNKQKEEKGTEKVSSNEEEKKESVNKESINTKHEEVINNNNQDIKKDDDKKDDDKKEDNKKEVQKNEEEKVNNLNKEEKTESKEEVKSTKDDKLEEQQKKELEDSNKPVTVNEEVKATIYERLNKKVIIVTLAITCTIVGVIIFAVKKFKKTT